MDKKKKLQKHSKHHSKKHMKEMKTDMKKGDSFAKAHSINKIINLGTTVGEANRKLRQKK